MGSLGLGGVFFCIHKVDISLSSQATLTAEQDALSDFHGNYMTLWSYSSHGKDTTFDFYVEVLSTFDIVSKKM